MGSVVDYGESHRRYLEARRNDSRSTDELVALALTTEDEDMRWDTIQLLWYRPNEELLRLAKQLFASDDPRRRELGANIIGQGGWPERIQADESLAVLLPMLEREQDPDALAAMCITAGHIRDSRVVEPLIRLKNHPNMDVRYGVVHGLGWKRDERAIAALLELSGDENPHARDWATFYLGELEEVDTPALRAALLARVNDEDDDTRAEALSGLAKRGDSRVIEPLLAELAAGDEISQLVFETAIEAGKQLGDPRLHPALLRLQALENNEYEREEIAAALARCQPPADAS